MVKHFDKGGLTQDYVADLLAGQDPTYGGAVNDQGLTSLQGGGGGGGSAYADSTGGGYTWGGLPTYMGPTDSGGPTSDDGAPIETNANASVTKEMYDEWMAANPGATDAEIASAIQDAGVDPEYLALIIGADPLEARQWFDANIVAPAQPTEPAPTTPAPAPTTPTTTPAPGGAQTAEGALGQVWDWIKDATGAFVVNPITGQVQSVWSYDPSIFGNTQPFIPVGGIPGTNTTAGVTTGNAAIDTIIGGILDKLGDGVDPTTIPDIIAGVISEKTGVPYDAAKEVVKGSAEVTNAVKDAVERSKIAIDASGGLPTDEVPVSPIVDVTGQSPLPSSDVTTPAYEVPVGQDVLYGGSGTTTTPKGEYGPGDEIPTSPTTVNVGGQPPLPGTGAGPSPDFEPTPETAVPVTPPWEVPPSDEVPTTPAGILGMLGLLATPGRTVRKDPGDLVDIDYLYDIGGDSIFAPMPQEIDKKLNARGDSKYTTGGAVSTQSVEELLRLLGI